MDTCDFNINRPVKRVYHAILTQTATNDPVSALLENTLSVPGWIRTVAGTFTLTKVGAFVVGKTSPAKAQSYFDEFGNKYKITPTSADVMTLQTFAAANTNVPADGILVNEEIYLEVYS